MKIPNEVLPEVYKVSKDVYHGKLSLTEGVNTLSTNDRMNKSSIRDYIYDFKYLMQGKRFTRTLNASSFEYFLRQIQTDYGRGQLTIALSALKQHIEYYESLKNGRLLQVRKIYESYLSKIKSVELITTFDELLQNIGTVENYLTEGDLNEKLEVSKYIMRGICFVAYQISEEIRFAPSKFLGYTNNSLKRHLPSETDGRETNEAISFILKTKPSSNEMLEGQYFEYCIRLGIQPKNTGSYGVQRKYWHLKLKNDFPINNDLSGEFPEGKIVERVHKSRERNSKVVQLAKEIFKNKYGRLYCQVCNFDFKNKYGQIGINFVEGHHTIAVSEMSPDYKTKPEEIAMLCANCHRMVHKKRPWLTMNELSKLINK